MINLDLIEVTNITKSTDQITQGSIYCCFTGAKFNGHDFINDAFSKGAKYVIGTEAYSINNYYQVENINAEMAMQAQKLYNFKQDDLNFYAITGTDGKTSTALIMSEILNTLNDPASYLGTSGLFINGEEVDYNGMTTPFADELYRNFQMAKAAKSNNFVMEVSSHSLEQERAYGLKYDVAIFTNLTSEHIDFHKTMENYYQAKAKLFNLLTPTGVGIINIDSEYGARLYAERSDLNLVAIGKNADADYVISEIKESLTGTCFNLTNNNHTYRVDAKLLVEFNVYNLTQAIVALVNRGYDIETVIGAANNFVVPGRMELMVNEEVANVIIDFAHTPDSILKIMEFVAKVKKDQKVYVVTGSAGERDSSKRPVMGKNAAHGADVLILTEDDPRSEAVSDINNDIKAGIDLSTIELIEIENRSDAIKYALTKAQINDIIILLGKGGQKKMYYDGYTTQYIEKQITQEKIKEVINERE